jgi:hypothetical protein
MSFKRIPLEQQIKDIARIKEKINTVQNGKVIYVTISGSDLYGFPSKDSDIDYRGCYLTGTHSLMGLHRPKDVIEMLPDIVMFELSKELGLAISGNCNVLEHIFAPSIYSTVEFLKMKPMIMNAMGKDGIYHSYKGLATFNYKKFIMAGKKSYKKYLYILRGLMACIYTMQTGKIQPDINELNKYFKIKEVKKLVEMKKNGVENDELEVEELRNSGTIDTLIVDLFARTDEAYTKSKMPNKVSPDDISNLNSFLIDLRREHMK